MGTAPYHADSGALRRISRVQVRAIAAPRGFAQGYVARESPWLYSAANFLRRKRKGNQGEKGPGKLLLKLLLLRLDLRAFLLNPSSCSCCSACFSAPLLCVYIAVADLPTCLLLARARPRAPTSRPLGFARSISMARRACLRSRAAYSRRR